MRLADPPRPVTPSRFDPPPPGAYLWTDSGGAGVEQHTITVVWVDALRHYDAPASRLGPSPDERFKELAGEWRRDTRFMSSTTDIALHPAYQQIIGMGKEAIPLILRELDREPDHWFWALWAISGEDPVPKEDRGRVHRMAEAWITWGKQRDYL